MPHVRTQLRNAVKTRLSTVSTLRGVHSASRHFRGYQTDNFPLALVAVQESASAAPGSFEGSRPINRDMRVLIQVGVEESMSDAEDTLDSVCVDIERALTSSDFGIGGVRDWKYEGTSVVDAAPTEDGLLIVQTLSYTCALQTLDSEPDRNLYPQ